MEAEERAAPFREQRVAYTGWLLTNPLFLAEVETLRSRELSFWQSVSDAEAMPHVEAMNAFLNRWQLCGMSSWELPNPQAPNLAGIEPPTMSRRGAESVLLELPLTVKLPARFPTREVVAEIRSSIAAPHLSEWLEVLNQESRSAPGLRRFGQLFQVRFLRDIVRSSRYEPRMAGSLSALDRAFGRYLNVGEDSVKSLRQEISRRLKK